MNKIPPDYEYKYTMDISAEVEKIVRQLTKRIDEEVLRSINDFTLIGLLREVEKESYRRGLLQKQNEVQE
jgi:hypothetical protein